MATAPPPSSTSVVGTLFLGGGNAAGYFAAEYDKIVSADPSLKDSAFGGSLAIVSGEQSLSYERPALSKAYLSPESPARLPGFHTCVGGGGERQERGWYEARGIKYFLGSEVAKIDAAAREATLADGSVLKWGKLVVATGARPVDLARDFAMPGAGSEGGGGVPSNVFYLRDVADADRLYSALEKQAAASDGVSGGARPLVIGGGYIGEQQRERERRERVTERDSSPSFLPSSSFSHPRHKKTKKNETFFSQASSSQPPWSAGASSPSSPSRRTASSPASSRPTPRPSTRNSTN